MSKSKGEKNINISALGDPKVLEGVNDSLNEGVIRALHIPGKIGV